MATSENFANQVVENAWGNTREQQQMPFWAETLENIPAWTAVQGYQGLRGGNTVMRGGWAGAKPAKGGFIRGAARNWLNPRSMTRFSHTSVFSPNAPYTPFGAARVGNYLSRGLSGNRSTRLGRGMSRLNLSVGSGGEAFTHGGYSRISAVAKIGHMSDARFARLPGTPMMGGPGLSRGAAQRNVLMGMGRTTIGGYVAGTASAFTVGGMGAQAGGQIYGGMMARQLSPQFMAGREAVMGAATKLGIEATEDLTLGTIKRQTAKKLATATTTRAAGGALLRGGALMAGRAALMAVPGINIAMAAWMVYDIAKLSTQLGGYMARTATEGVRSFQGGLNTGIMDQNFQDSEAAMTSRSRGVQAIQNSRLNARSVLGAEAGMMASHFG